MIFPLAGIINSETGETLFKQIAKLPNGALKSIDFVTLVDILSEDALPPVINLFYRLMPMSTVQQYQILIMKV